MTWPFENDTSAIVKKLAKRNVSSNRIFCFFNVLTIALAISLIVGISLFQQGSKISEQKILNQMQQATIGGLTAEQIEVLKKEPDLEDIVPYKHSDSFLMDGIKFEAVYMPTGFGIIKSYELVSGTCPEQYNEIVIDKNVQLELGYQLNIGDTITLPTAGSKTEDFIITGFTDNVETGTFYFYVSPAYAEQGVLLSDIPYSALIRVNGATEMGLIDFENTVYRLALSQDISRNQLYFNSKFCSSLISGSGMGGVLLATLFIAFSSGIVIYSVFYLSVSNQVSQIGQLKTIGMTEKQIKRMIRKEGYRFCLFGIPAGITVGIIFAYLLEPNGITIINAIATSILAIILGMPYSGDLPASENEIVVQESFLDSLGYSNELGQTIQIPFSDGTTHDFKLTGILDVKTGDIGRYTAIISKELVRQQYGDEGMIDYYIGLKGAQNMSEEEATNYANTLAQQLKISDDNVIVRSTYFNLKDENHGSDMLFYFLIGFVTFIGSGIVIYSIFYISVASSIRNYGQLRTIGTTKRQIKKMVYREGKLLAAIAIPIGLVIGNVIGYFLIPAGWYWLTTLCVTVGVGLFAFIIVMIAIHTPVKRAAAVSPLEALRYSDYQGKMKESSVLHRKITPASLAKMNLSRQKAKSTLTILSLSLGGVLVVLISTMLVSYDGVAEARGRAFPVGEFNIQLNANQSWDTAGISLSGLQQKNFLNADFINAVESIDGVTGIKHWYYTDAEYRVNGNSGKWIQGFCRDEQQNLEKERIAGTTDYDELVAGNGIVLLQERADLYDIEAALGDTVEVDYKTESGQIRTKAYTVMGIVNEYSYSGFSKCFALPEQFMNEATGIDCTGTISVITDMKKYDTVEAALNQLIDGNSDLVMETIKESITYYSGLQQLSFGVLLIVAVIVVCFSLINLVNTTITNFLSRRQEIGMLQAIGLSKKQLIKMLCYEGLMYSVFATLVTLVLGTGLGFLSVQVVVKTMNPYFYYSFPWLIVLIYLAILLIVQFTLISYTTGNLKKQSLVEQIRTME